MKGIKPHYFLLAVFFAAVLFVGASPVSAKRHSPKKKSFTPVYDVMYGFMDVEEALLTAEEVGGRTVEFVEDNPSCTDLGYQYGRKIEGVPSGVYSIDGINTVTISSSNPYIDWSSTLGIDAVIMKGGNGANLYAYDPESYGDNDLHPPVNSSGGPASISHVEFCYDYELMVSKTANPSLTRTWNWTIDKTVDPDEHYLFDGQSASSEYTVSVEKTGYVDSKWYVWGEITVENPDPEKTYYIDRIEDHLEGGTKMLVDCATDFELEPGESYTCTYSADLPNDETRTNYAEVVLEGDEPGGMASAVVDFSEASITPIRDEIHVTDTNGPSWMFSESGSRTYTEDFDCDDMEYDGSHDMETYPNTATIVETGQSASASVEVNCYLPEIEKDATTYLRRTYTWEIEKTADPEILSMWDGESKESEYTIEVTKSEPMDSDWRVQGSIWINNPNPEAAYPIEEVNDSLSGLADGVMVECEEDLPYMLPAGESLHCGYAADLDDGDFRVNTAEVVSEEGITGASATADVDFEKAVVTEVDPNVHVSDTNEGVGPWEFSDTGSATYSRMFDCDGVNFEGGYGEKSYPNTATIEETEASDDAEVMVRCYQVGVSKTAETSITNTYGWDIQKSVTPDELNLFDGETGSVQYEIAVTKSEEPEETVYMVEGKIYVENPRTDASYMIHDVADEVSGGIGADVDCGVGFPYSLSPGETLECDYYAELPNDSDRENHAVVYPEDDIEGGEAYADVDFSEAELTEVYDEVTVEDEDLGEDWVTDHSDTFTLEKTFDCEGVSWDGHHAMYAFPNTAEILQTGQDASANVDVNCWLLDVTKTAQSSYSRMYKWDIEKTGSETMLELPLGELAYVDYSVMVSYDPEYTDGDWMVEGMVRLENPSPMPAVIKSVEDMLDGVSASLDCGDVDFPHIIDGHDYLECSYGGMLEDGSVDVNTAVATQKLYHHHIWEGNPEYLGVDKGYSATAPVLWGGPSEVIDECVDVDDTYAGFLGTACVESAPVSYYYTRQVGPYEVCGSYMLENVASFVTNDMGVTGSDDWTVQVEVPCVDLGCTYTQGYWKTHGDPSNTKKYDETWDELIDGSSTKFFLSDQSYMQVLRTSPKKGNAYYILAHQYIAAELNMLWGASAPESVENAMAEAEKLFETYTPKEVVAKKFFHRSDFTDLAELLDDYNNGYIGPGHCD